MSRNKERRDSYCSMCQSDSNLEEDPTQSENIIKNLEEDATQSENIINNNDDFQILRDALLKQNNEENYMDPIDQNEETFTVLNDFKFYDELFENENKSLHNFNRNETNEENDHHHHNDEEEKNKKKKIKKKKKKK